MDPIMDPHSGPFRGIAAPALRVDGVEVKNHDPVGSRAWIRAKRPR